MVIILVVEIDKRNSADWTYSHFDFCSDECIKHFFPDLEYVGRLFSEEYEEKYGYCATKCDTCGLHFIEEGAKRWEH